MSGRSPIGDGNGTRGGCRTLAVFFALSLALVLAAVVAVAHGCSQLVDKHPSPTSSTSSRSTP